MTFATGTIGWAVAAFALLLALGLRRELGRRAELVARACHEVRGPLTAAVLGLHAARRHGEAPQGRVAAVELELLRAGAALDDLEAARCRRGGRRQERDEVVDVTRLLACQAEAWGEVARAHGCAVRLLEASPGTNVRGDPVRLSQATGNLIANAIEHGRGAVGLCARTVGDRVRIEVLDGGPGLPAPVGVLARRPRAGRGARGRGLAIASEIVARHGGRLSAAPSTGGARIAIDLPAAASAGVVGGRHPTPRSSGARGRTG
jgi:signal transduction histidine kinase